MIIEEKALVLGCGKSPRFITQCQSHSGDIFDTVDTDLAIAPDFLGDITSNYKEWKSDAKKIKANTYHFIYCEHLPCDVYNDEQVLKNINGLLHPSGFVCIKSLGLTTGGAPENIQRDIDRLTNFLKRIKDSGFKHVIAISNQFYQDSILRLNLTLFISSNCRLNLKKITQPIRTCVEYIISSKSRNVSNTKIEYGKFDEMQTQWLSINDFLNKIDRDIQPFKDAAKIKQTPELDEKVSERSVTKLDRDENQGLSHYRLREINSSNKQEALKLIIKDYLPFFRKEAKINEDIPADKDSDSINYLLFSKLK